MISTSNFARNGKNPNAVAISFGVPKGWYGKRYKLLAPAGYLLKASDKEFDDSYYTKLSKLNAKQVYDEIIELFGQDAVLLCWESPNVRCHRRIVAEWFEKELGIIVPEFGFQRSEIKPYSEMTDKVEKPSKNLTQLALFDENNLF